MPVLRYGVHCFYFHSSCTFSDNDSFEPVYLILSDPKLQLHRWRCPRQWHSGCMGLCRRTVNRGFSLPAKVPLITTGRSYANPDQCRRKENADKTFRRNILFYPLVQLCTWTVRHTIPLNYQYKDETYFDFYRRLWNFNAPTDQRSGWQYRNKVIYHKWRCRIRQ